MMVPDESTSKDYEEICDKIALKSLPAEKKAHLLKITRSVLGYRIRHVTYFYADLMKKDLELSHK